MPDLVHGTADEERDRLYSQDAEDERRSHLTLQDSPPGTPSNHGAHNSGALRGRAGTPPLGGECPSTVALQHLEDALDHLDQAAELVLESPTFGTGDAAGKSHLYLKVRSAALNVRGVVRDARKDRL